MWNIIIVAVFLVTVNAANTGIEQFTGVWIPVAFYPNIGTGDYVACLRVSLCKSSKDVLCTCDDGKKTELLEVYIPVAQQFIKDGKDVTPMIVVDDVKEVPGSLNVACTCDNIKYSNRVVARSVNENYFVIYKFGMSNDGKQPYGAYINARNPPSLKELRDVMKSIEDLSGRNGSVLCTSEHLNDE